MMETVQTSRQTSQSSAWLAALFASVAWIIFAADCKGQDAGLATIEPKQGSSFQARLAGSKDDEFTIEHDGTTRTLALEDLVKIQFAKEASANTGKYLLRLRDGGKLRCDELSSDGQLVTVSSKTSKNSFDTKLVDSVQLNELTAEQEKSWREYVGAELSADILVLRQANGQLTKIEGIVLGIEPAAVQFEFSGQTVPVAFERLAGLRLFNAQQPRKNPQIGEIRDVLGSVLGVAAIRKNVGDPNQLSANLVGGGSITLDFSELLDIRFSGRPTLFLADLDPIRQSGKSSFAFNTSTLEQARSQLVHRIPKRSIPGSEVGPGIEFRGVGEAVFVTPADYSKLVGSVALTPTGERFTNCHVEVYSEKTLLWKQELTESGRYQVFDIPVTSGERLRIVVASEAEMQTGIRVRWQQPFFTN